MADRRAVITVGSVHMDLIAAADRLPGPGESVAGGTFSMAPGGKAGNQAIQFARCGLDSYVLTRLGDDAFGRDLLATLHAQGVRTDLVVIDRERATGASTIFAAGGDYSSIIAPGAAAALTDDDIAAMATLRERLAAVVLQLELPIDRALVAAGLARRLGAMVVLNASPMPDRPGSDLAELVAGCTLVVVNRVEAARLADCPPETVGLGLARALRARYPVEQVIVTLGSEGAIVSNTADSWAQPPFPAVVQDAVGAGDAFLGAFVAARIAGEPAETAIRRAAAAGAITVARPGGGASLPSAREIDDYLAYHEGVALARRCLDE